MSVVFKDWIQVGVIQAKSGPSSTTPWIMDSGPCFGVLYGPAPFPLRTPVLYVVSEIRVDYTIGALDIEFLQKKVACLGMILDMKKS